jgi:hypothetical protein
LCFVFVFNPLFFFLRQDLAMSPRLTSNSGSSMSPVLWVWEWFLKALGQQLSFFFFFPNILGFLNPALSLSKQNYALFSFICESVSGIFRVLTHFAWTQPGCGALAHYKCDTVTGQRCVRCVTWCYFEKVQRFLASAEGEHQNTFNSVLFNGKGNLKNGTAGTVCGA